MTTRQSVPPLRRQLRSLAALRQAEESIERSRAAREGSLELKMALADWRESMARILGTKAIHPTDK